MTKPTRVLDEIPLQELVKRSSNAETSSAANSSSPDDLSKESIVILFATFARRWPHLWAPVSQDKAGRSSWKRDLISLGVTDAVVGFGIDKSAGLEFPPSPAKFAELCAEGAGLPDLEAAWSEALTIARRWKRPHECSHPAVWHALDQVGGFTGLDEDVLRTRFERNYEKARKQFLSGKPFAAIPQPLPAPKDAQPDFTSEQALAAKADALAKINAMFGKRASA